MKVGVDANEANVANKVGVNVYAFELLWALYKLQADNKNKNKPINYTLYLSQKPRNDMPKATSWWKYEVIPAKTKWVLTKLTPYLLKNKDELNVFFTPSHYLPPLMNIPGVCSIMDLGYLEFSGQFAKKDFWQLKLWTARSISISKQIISISKSTKKDIVRHYNVKEDRVVVAYPAYDHERFDVNLSKAKVDKVKKKYSIVGDYILFLSTLKPSKNLVGLIKAYSMLNDELSMINDMQLVVAGKKGWLFDSIFEIVKKLELEEKVKFLGFIDEDDKPALIKGAKVFTLPSFWEGFGFDPLYAMSLGVPVVVSDRGSLPEVVGEAGVLVNPDNVSDIAEKIMKVLRMDKASYNSMVERGVKRAKTFSWEKTARKVLETLEKAANENER